MDNAKLLITRYEEVDGGNRSRFRAQCSKSSSTKELVKITKVFIDDWSKVPKETDIKISTILMLNEDRLFSLTKFENILETLYNIFSNFDAKGLTTSLYYNLSAAIAFHNNVDINKVYLNKPKAQKALKHFLAYDYEQYLQKYKNHHIFNKCDLPKGFWKIDSDTIQDMISTSSEVFQNYRWEKIDK